jgi:hypothetical protein
MKSYLRWMMSDFFLFVFCPTATILTTGIKKDCCAECLIWSPQETLGVPATVSARVPPYSLYLIEFMMIVSSLVDVLFPCLTLARCSTPWKRHTTIALRYFFLGHSKYARYTLPSFLEDVDPYRSQLCQLLLFIALTCSIFT